MKRKADIIIALALGLTGCASSQLPVDDAYYWSEKSPITNHQSPIPNAPKEPTPSVEFTNVQDTTVTIRIHK